jgi:cytochrome P450
VPKDAKYAIGADTLPDGTMVEAGCCMLWSNYVLGRDPTLWPEPGVFRPERWLDETEGGGCPMWPAWCEEQRHCRPPLSFTFGCAATAGGGDGGSLWRPTTQVSDFKYPVFHGGPRLCLGRPLAYLELQMVLGAVLERYELTEVGTHSEEYVNSLVAPMKHGLTVTVARR